MDCRPDIRICFVCQMEFTSNEPGPDCEDNGDDEDNVSRSAEFNKLIKFVESHLHLCKMELDAIQENTKDKKGSQQICGSCISIVESACGLYDEMYHVLGKLSKKLKQLSTLLLNVSRTQGNIDEQIRKMRNTLGTKCQLHCRRPINYGSFSIPELESRNQGFVKEADATGQENKYCCIEDMLDVKIETDSLADDASMDSMGDRAEVESGSVASEEDSDPGENKQDSEYQSTSKSWSTSMTEKSRVSVRLAVDNGSSIKSKVSVATRNAGAKRNPRGSSETKTKLKSSHPFVCDLCENRFTRKRTVILHKLRIHDIPLPPPRNRPYKCDICNGKFKSRISIKAHRRRFHSGIRSNLPQNTEQIALNSDNDVAELNEQITSSLAASNVLDPSYNENKAIADSSEEMSRSKMQKDPDDKNVCNDKTKFTKVSKLAIHKNPMHNISRLESQQHTRKNPETTKSPAHREDIGLRLSGSAVQTDTHSFECDVCHRWFTRKWSVALHKKNVHQIQLPPPRDRPFTCNICNKNYKSKRSLLSHTQRFHRPDLKSYQNRSRDQVEPGIVTEEVLTDKPSDNVPVKAKSHRCHLCSKSYDLIYSLDLHLRVKHAQERTFKCSHCPLEFPARRLLTHHQYEVHKKDKKSLSFMSRVACAKGKNQSDNINELCVVCGVEFLSWNLLSKHLADHEKKIPEEEKHRKCYFCSKLFAHEQSIWAHLRSSQIHDYTQIDFCCDHSDHWGLAQWVYQTPTELEEHIKLEHPDDNAVVKCADCDWPFLDRSMLDLHRLMHLPKVNLKYQCPVCHNHFLFADTLRDHYNTEHGANLRLYRCEICKWGFSTRNGYRIHLKFHEDPTKKKVQTGDNATGAADSEIFSCTECPKYYSTAIQLRDHKRTMHVTKQCQECGLVVTSGKLNRHMVMHHSGAGKHLCTECGKVYRTKGGLSKHMSNHGVHRYHCQDCGKGYATGRLLRKHALRVHSDKCKE